VADNKPIISLTGQVAIVTGGTRGIGRAITEALLEAGCEVAICGRNAPDSLPQAGGRTASFHPCDIRKPDDARAFVDKVAETHGRLDIVVNNAGGSPYAAAATASPRFSEAVLALNLLGPLHIAQAAFRWMEAQDRGGSIVNIASVSGVRPSPGTAMYGAAKAGLLSLTQSLAQEWGPKVRVNAIVAGLIDTDDAEAIYGSVQAQADIAASLPLKRMGRGRDIADTVLYLSSPLAAYVSGARLSVDGGGERPLYLELMKAAAP
jgi:NAD(P)-dependent dehydrogenase (short-subunit alcohol dehydrogenase family)